MFSSIFLPFGECGILSMKLETLNLMNANKKVPKSVRPFEMTAHSGSITQC